MLISCAICAEMFKNSDSNNINVTHCGHVFHSECLRKWFERSKTCPECRHKTSNVIKIYCNILSYSEQSNTFDDSEYQNSALQNENDNLKYKLIEKDGEIKSKETVIDKLSIDMKKLKSNQTKSKDVILKLEREIEKYEIFQKENRNEINALKVRLKEIDQLKNDLAVSKTQLMSLQAVRTIISASLEETDKLMKERRSDEELVTMVVSLKKELESKRIEQHEKNRKIQNFQTQLQEIKASKVELEETVSMLESKVFQLENRKNHIESPKPLPLAVMALSNDEAENSITKKVIAVEKTNKSPFLHVRSSSIAGLTRKRPSVRPLPRPATTNPSSASEKFSIFKKQRMC